MRCVACGVLRVSGWKRGGGGDAVQALPVSRRLPSSLLTACSGPPVHRTRLVLPILIRAVSAFSFAVHCAGVGSVLLVRSVCVRACVHCTICPHDPLETRREMCAQPAWRGMRLAGASGATALCHAMPCRAMI